MYPIHSLRLRKKGFNVLYYGATCLMLVSCVAYSCNLKMEAKYSSETFSGLHGVMFQKIETFITTGVRTSNPTIRRKISDDLTAVC
jgi:hypothetical protein